MDDISPCLVPAISPTCCRSCLPAITHTCDATTIGLRQSTDQRIVSAFCDLLAHLDGAPMLILDPGQFLDPYHRLTPKNVALTDALRANARKPGRCRTQGTSACENFRKNSKRDTSTAVMSNSRRTTTRLAGISI